MAINIRAINIRAINPVTGSHTLGTANLAAIRIKAMDISTTSTVALLTSGRAVHAGIRVTVAERS
jgi:hypothetical protein